MAIEVLIFDFDGLILDTETPFYLSWREIYVEHGLFVSPGEWAALVGSSVDPPEAYRLLEAHLDRPVDRTAIRERRMARETELLRAAQPLPGVRELIDEAVSQGLRLGIASSSGRAWVVGHLAAAGLLDRFEAITSADDVTVTKPAPELYDDVLCRLGVLPERALAFEDSQHGVAAAKAAGLYCIAVPNEITRHAAFTSADQVLDTLAGHRLVEFLDAAESHYRARGRQAAR